MSDSNQVQITKNGYFANKENNKLYQLRFTSYKNNNLNVNIF